jgi:hypothetical protein
LFVVVDGDVGFGGGEHDLCCRHGRWRGGGGVEGGEESIFRSHRSAGDGGDVFDADESVGHCDFWLVEEVVEEASLFAGDATRWGCHSVVRMLVLLSVLAFINGCFL